MRSFTFHPGPRLIAGADKSKDVADLLPKGPVLFVTDEQLTGLGITDAARDALEASGKPVTIFDKVEADPSRATLEAAVEAGRSAGAASIVGFGGGSPMDVAKLAAYLLGSGDDVDSVWGVDIARGAFSNAPVAGVHALAYPLGGLHHLPHGVTNALMLRHVLQHNAEAARDHYAELAPIVVPECEPEGSQARVALLIDRLDQLVRESGIAPRLRDYGIDIGEAPLLAREAMKQTRLLVNNPCEITEADARRLYEAAW